MVYTTDEQTKVSKTKDIKRVIRSWNWGNIDNTMTKWKGQTIHNTTQKTKDHKTGGELRCFIKVNSSWFITGFVTRLARRVPLVEQELPIFPEHLSSPPVID
jgi:hypothetical protein